MSEISQEIQQILVSFSGIDGAGKSAQISRLESALRGEGLQVKLVAFWDDVVVLKRLREALGHKVFKGDKGVGSPEAPIRRRDKNVRSPMLTMMRMAFYVLDALSLRRAVRTARHKKSDGLTDVIIFDRFIYDELANLNSNRAPTRLYISAILGLSPRPDAAFLLDADPDAAFARKPEYPLDFLHANRSAYLNLARMAKMKVIAPAPIDQAHAAVLRHFRKKKNAPRPQVEAAGHQESISASPAGHGPAEVLSTSR
jgi:thymidylate kinase